MKKNHYPSPSALLKNPNLLLAFGFGSGLIRPASGTWGSLMAALIFLPISAWAREHLIISLIFLTLAFIIGCHICNKASKTLNVHDHSGIVWDEFIGIWLTLLLIPHLYQNVYPLYINTLIGFTAFRLFDISKPPPIKYFDKNTQTGFGIMIDDILAALYAILLIYIIQQIIHFN